MARIMVAVMPFTGHIAPVAAVVDELCRRGHGVRVYTGRAYADAFPDDVRVVLWESAPDFNEHDLQRTFPQLRGHTGPRQMLANVEHLFIRTAPGQVADLLRAWQDEPWDLLVSETLSLGAPLAAELTPSPWTSLCVVPLSWPSDTLPPPGLGLSPRTGFVGGVRDAALRPLTRMATRPLQRALSEVRRAVGLPPSSTSFECATISTVLTLATGVPMLDFDRTDLPTFIRYVGSLAPLATTPVPPWWPEIESALAPIVYVTQGTLNTTPDDLIKPTLEALADLDVLVVASTGRRGEVALPFPVPSNARVADFIPHGALLPRSSVMVTNGGWGGVLNALRTGVPLVIAGGDLDKPEVAARVAWAGAGINLHTGSPSISGIRHAVHRVLTDERFGRQAALVQVQLLSHGGAAEAADLMEHLL